MIPAVQKAKFTDTNVDPTFIQIQSELTPNPSFTVSYLPSASSPEAKLRQVTSSFKHAYGMIDQTPPPALLAALVA